MFYYIYKITNIKNNKFYHGSHKTAELDDGYFGSGIYLKRAIARHGQESFIKEIVLFCESEEEMLRKETEYLQKYKNDLTYNLKFCASGGNTRESYTPSQKAVYIQKLVNNPNSPIGKRGSQAFNYGMKVPEATKAAMKLTHAERFKRLRADSSNWRKYTEKMRVVALRNLQLASKVRSIPIQIIDNTTGISRVFNTKTKCAAYFKLSVDTLTKLLSGQRIRGSAKPFTFGQYTVKL